MNSLVVVTVVFFEQPSCLLRPAERGRHRKPAGPRRHTHLKGTKNMVLNFVP